jgi:hypothetical protein
MKRQFLLPIITVAAMTFSSGLLVHAQQTSPNADNTKVNQRDRAQGEPTADQGKNNLSDREVMQKIRKSVMDDKSLSTYAHNVKVVSQNRKSL